MRSKSTDCPQEQFIKCFHAARVATGDQQTVGMDISGFSIGDDHVATSICDIADNVMGTGHMATFKQVGISAEQP
jgi:hypothetical protein